MPDFRLLDVIALANDRADLGLVKGQVGTLVEQLQDNVFDVEFSDDQGRTYTTAALRTDELIRLHHRPVKAA
jgi:hypothetical protein